MPKFFRWRKRVNWNWLVGVRIGEATNPGPGIEIISHNVDGLEAHADGALAMDASVFAWQEVEVNRENRSSARAQLEAG